MPYDYVAAFPLPPDALPPRLRQLLQPVGLAPDLGVEVACMHESDPHGPKAEHVHLQMAVVAEVDGEPISVLDEAGRGVVAYSVPAGEARGCVADLLPSVSGHDYIVASWGNGSFYTFNLAEKVWMTLGLTPRCVGNEHQRIVFDELDLPEFGVAEGEASADFYWTLRRNVCWRMRNEYLRRYLWLRGARGFRVFFYEAQLHDSPAIRSLMGDSDHVDLSPSVGSRWYSLDIRRHNGGLLLQVWASVEAVTCELCPEQSAEGILWPGDHQPMTHARADSLREQHYVYLDDRFLERYEQSAFYDSHPVNVRGAWHCSPSYRGQWAFTDCRRIGRNMIRVPMRELYKPKPDREIVHARAYALDPAIAATFSPSEEHIVGKVDRLVVALLRLGDGLAQLAPFADQDKSADDLIGLSRRELQANGWLNYPKLCRLAQVAPLDMTQQAFLARCKSLHEIWQCIPDGFIRQLLLCAGCPKGKVKELASLKLLQALFNIVQRLNREDEKRDAFASSMEPPGWNDRNPVLAPIFLNNDLRIADAHETFTSALRTLQDLGFDIAGVTAGYGRALDFMMDAVTGAFDQIAGAIESLVTNC